MPQLILILVYITYWPSVLLISMVLFRIKPRHHIRQIILSTLLLTQTSILLQTYKAEFLLAFIQPICLMTCIFFFYKLKIIHSFIVAVVTFGFNLVIESAFNLFLANFNYIEFVKIYQNDYAIQGLILTLINCGVALLLQKLRLGFSFISSHPLNSKSSLYPKKIILNFESA
ncbi:hypothetical protein SK3146_02054 [Paenibacillus konkukensis]|uniref:Uncharacterized protein n=1 Tax=Paenibacillus konkukensis TaxID=2020716 RepID=A0ABY4RMK8_9BACL|nr:hypothetical protein SK3146_02054 [Paenibacillus konkukensis]